MSLVSNVYLLTRINFLKNLKTKTSVSDLEGALMSFR